MEDDIKTECPLCRKKRKTIITHHISYEPEITIGICRGCHLLLHTLAAFDEESRNQIIIWIEKYGYQWIGGHEKFLKSQHRRDYWKKWRQNEEVKKRCREYAKRYRANHPDRLKEWRKSESGRVSNEKYNQSEKRKASLRRYYAKTKNKNRHR